MILPKIPKQLSVKLLDSNTWTLYDTWVLYDLSNLTFNNLDPYLDYAILPHDVGLIAENDSPSNVLMMGLAGEYLVKNKSDGRLIVYTEDRFRKFYPSVI